MSSILLTIPEELKGVLSTFEYLSSDKLIKIQFSQAHQNKLIFNPFDLNDFANSLKQLERKVKIVASEIPASRYYLIENCIYQELDKLRQADNNSTDPEVKSPENVKIQSIRKFDFGDRSYESVIVDNKPYFITRPELVSDGDQRKEYSLEEHIELSDITLLPLDNILTTNPLPYSFASEEELNGYLEKAKHESFDSLFHKVFDEFKKYVNISEYVLTVLSADIIYSYFQDRFGTTHYNIFIGENGSGKNSALLVFKYLGYRVFYVTAASAANYYTFLGDIQEGQGTIAEDEADDIGEDKDKQRILKTGYASGGTVPKIEFSRNGTRSQKPYLTFCHKWLAMEEIPDERKIRGTLDRSFIFKFLAGEVRYNIKDIFQDENSVLFDTIKDLRKTLFVFKFLHQSYKFEDININIKNRNAELTKPLLRLFKNSQSFEQIRKSLSTLIKEKSQLKSNSTEAKIFEALADLISDNYREGNDSYQFTNEQVFDAVKKTMEGLENQYDGTYSTFITPDGQFISKKKIKQILVSKFNAVPDKINVNGKTDRVIRISKNWVDTIGKQYEVIEEILLRNTQCNNRDDFCDRDTMTDVTLLESVSTTFKKEIDVADIQTENSKVQMGSKNQNPLDNNITIDDLESDKSHSPFNTDGNNDNQSSNLRVSQLNDGDNNLKSVSANNINYMASLDVNGSNYLTKNTKNMEQASSESVTSVTSVTIQRGTYPCLFCSEYSTSIDFDMQLHLLEKHKKELLSLPISGSLDQREDYVIAESKRRMMRETSRVLDEDD